MTFELLFGALFASFLLVGLWFTDGRITRRSQPHDRTTRSSYTRQTQTRRQAERVHVHSYRRRDGVPVRAHERSAPTAGEPFPNVSIQTTGRPVPSQYTRWQALDQWRAARCAAQCGVTLEPAALVRFYAATQDEFGNRHVWLAVDRAGEITRILQISE